MNINQKVILTDATHFKKEIEPMESERKDEARNAIFYDIRHIYNLKSVRP